MAEQDYLQAALFEHRFWLQIFGDHARFILVNLAPQETAEIQRAAQFKGVFDALLDRARGALNATELASLNQEANRAAQELRQFKLHLLSRQLDGQIAVGLPPSLFNHMLNELEEYQSILASLLAGEAPAVLHPLHYHLLWLSDAAGHAAFADGRLDDTEAELHDMARRYEDHFNKHYLKAVAMTGFLRTGLTDFPSLDRFNRQADSETDLFRRFLLELRDSILKKEVLGTLPGLAADHMAREECYYLTKLARAAGLELPDCDPTRPRVEAK